jgi:hypothetical protein
MEDDAMRICRSNRFATFTLAVGLAGVAAPLYAADTLTGEVVDMACYVPHPATGRGPSHKKCAETCLKKGIPMGLLTDDKQLYLVLEDHDNPKPYAELKDKGAQTVTIEGNKVSQGGVQAIVVEVVK